MTIIDQEHSDKIEKTVEKEMIYHQRSFSENVERLSDKMNEKNNLLGVKKKNKYYYMK